MTLEDIKALRERAVRMWRCHTTSGGIAYVHMFNGAPIGDAYAALPKADHDALLADVERLTRERDAALALLGEARGLLAVARTYIVAPLNEPGRMPDAIAPSARDCVARIDDALKERG